MRPPFLSSSLPPSLLPAPSLFFCLPKLTLLWHSLDEEEIEKRCDELRAKLLADLKRNGAGSAKRSFKSHEVHGMADAKIKESERLRSALKISKDYQEGDHWRRQEERARGLAGEGGEKERGKE